MKSEAEDGKTEEEGEGIGRTVGDEALEALEVASAHLLGLVDEGADLVARVELTKL